MRIRALALWALVWLPWSGGTAAGETAGAKADALAELDALAGEVGQVAMELWQLSETALREERSAARLIAVLERQGFEVERGSAGLATAFVASWGSGRPIGGR